MVVLVLIVYTFLIIYEFIPLHVQKINRDFWVNAILCFFSFTMAVLISLGVDIPSPEAPIREFITGIFGK